MISPVQDGNHDWTWMVTKAQSLMGEPVSWLRHIKPRIATEPDPRLGSVTDGLNLIVNRPKYLKWSLLCKTSCIEPMSHLGKGPTTKYGSINVQYCLMQLRQWNGFKNIIKLRTKNWEGEKASHQRPLSLIFYFLGMCWKTQNTSQPLDQHLPWGGLLCILGLENHLNKSVFL